MSFGAFAGGFAGGFGSTRALMKDLEDIKDKKLEKPELPKEGEVGDALGGGLKPEAAEPQAVSLAGYEQANYGLRGYFPKHKEGEQ